MARGWRFIGVAGTIVAYVAGILILSIISLQNPQQRRGRNDRHYAENNLQQHEIGLLKRPLLRWCSELKFLGHQKSPFSVKSVKPLETFPGHPVKNNRDFILDSSDKSDTKLFVDSYFSSTNHRNRNTNNNNSNNKITTSNKNTKSSDNVSEFTIKTEPLKPNYSYRSKLVNNNDDSDVSDTTILREKIIALASFPGSGNTWLRYLLQQATGILTGSVYKDYGLLKSGFPAESISNSSVLVVKTHEWGSNAWTKFTKAILLIRDPAKAILAEFNRQSGGHVGFASPDRYKRTKGKYWSKFVKNKLWSWEQTNLSWGKNYTGAIKIVYYDDLVEDVENTLRDILTFLEFPINEDLMSCTISRKEGIYRRKKRLLNFDPYSPQMHKLISSTAAVVYAELGRTKFHSTRH